MMQAMRNLPAIVLAALMLPALLLPADATLCICAWFGKPAPTSCCSRPCCARKPSPTPGVRAAGCPGCGIATLDRATVAPSNERVDAAAAAPAPLVLALEVPLAAPASPRIDSFLREELRRPPPLLARAQPLRL